MADVLRELVLPKLQQVRKNGSGFEACCPAHDDHNPSLTVSPGKDHPVVLHCHAGCSPDLILDALGLTWADLSQPQTDPQVWTPRGPAVAVYPYTDEQGRLLFEVCRTADKQFPQRVPDPSRQNGWSWRLGETRRVLYRLPTVLAAVNDGLEIYVCEGEKDVHALADHGIVATCNPGGAGKWKPEYAEHLREADVVIVADRDEPGQNHARQVYASLRGIAAKVRVVEAAVGKDAADHLGAGKLVAELVTIAGGEEPAPDLAPDLWEFLGTDDPPHDWVAPGLLERGDRLILTGFEGLGKSMLVRQLAIGFAAGVHPFTLKQFRPQRVLFIDCENSTRQSRRRFRPLAAASIRYEHRVPDGALRLIHRPEGIDLTREEDAAWLLERVTAHQPDVLFIGPFYRLHAANLNEELPARRAVAVLDRARVQVDCALIIEAHAGHGEHGKNRSVRPAGSSLLMRWPEFGLGIAPADPRDPRHVEVRPWRGARDERDWPTHLMWGDPEGFPWVEDLSPEELNR